MVHLLAQQMNCEHNEESKKALRNIAMIAKHSSSDKMGVELMIIMSKAMAWDNPNLLHDIDSVVKGIIEKMNTGSAVMGILEILKKLETPALQTMLEHLMDIIKERSNISFFGKEIGARLKEVRNSLVFHTSTSGGKEKCCIGASGIAGQS